MGAIAELVHAGQHYECAWDLFRFGQLKAGTHEQAAAELAGWCRRVRLTPSFEIRKVRGADVVYVVLRSGVS